MLIITVNCIWEDGATENVFLSVWISKVKLPVVVLLYYQHDNLLIPVNGISAVLFLFF